MVRIVPENALLVASENEYPRGSVPNRLDRGTHWGTEYRRKNNTVPYVPHVPLYKGYFLYFYFAKLHDVSAFDEALPGGHEFAPTLQNIRPAIGSFHLVARHMGKRLFRYLVRK